jgi:hypothetical protein
MADYINCGAWTSRGIRVQTKSELKSLIAQDPDFVRFDPTSMHPGSNNNGEDIHGGSIPDGVILSVCGPDPARNRKWYAMVTKGKRGGIKVS